MPLCFVPKHLPLAPLALLSPRLAQQVQRWFLHTAAWVFSWQLLLMLRPGSVPHCHLSEAHRDRGRAVRVCRGSYKLCIGECPQSTHGCPQVLLLVLGHASWSCRTSNEASSTLLWHSQLRGPSSACALSVVSGDIKRAQPECGGGQLFPVGGKIRVHSANCISPVALQGGAAASKSVWFGGKKEKMLRCK